MDGAQEILNELKQHLVMPIDFKAQQRLDHLSHIVLGIGSIVSFGYGYFTQSLYNMMVCFCVFFVMMLLIVLPPLPSYRKNNLKWVETKIAK
ncbi:Signal peptidase complex subunit 1 [Nakaseomyces bracarensis]|uniref:Signal peptidase complex subunit 1 n=1 Tax=Nakaseomyces bracarensis TaxID=273131 RepID=A0ABR4NR92_9SACH